MEKGKRTSSLSYRRRFMKRVWREGGRMEKAKQNLSRLVERGYLKRYMIKVEGWKRDFR